MARSRSRRPIEWRSHLPDFLAPGGLDRRSCLHLALLALASLLVVYAPIVFTTRAFWGSGTDLPALQFPVRDYALGWLRQGVLPWWNPYIFAGLPFLSGPHPFYYPPWWLGALTSTALWIRLEILLHAFLAVLSMACLARFLRASLLAAWLAGVSYGLGGFFTAHLFAGHLDLLDAYAYLPLAFLSQLAAVRFRGLAWTALAAVVWAWAGLIGNYQALYWMGLLWLYPLLTSLAGRNHPVPVWALRRPWLREPGAVRSEAPGAELAPGVPLARRLGDLAWALARAALCCLITAGLLAFQYLPQLETRPYLAYPSLEGTETGVSWLNWLLFLYPHLFERTASAFSFARWPTWEVQPYVGLVGLLAVACALLGPWRRWLPLALGAGGFFLLAVGNALPVLGWYVHLDPLARSFEVPGRYLALVTLFLCLLQAQGYDWLLSPSAARARRPLQIALAMTGFSCLLWGVLFFLPPENSVFLSLLQGVTSPEEWLNMQVPEYPEEPAGILVVSGLRVGLSSLVLFYLLLCLRQLRQGRWGWLAVLVLADLSIFCSPYLASVEPSALLLAREADSLLRQVGPQRFTASPDLIGVNAAMAFGFASIGGYDVASARPLDRAIADIQGGGTTRVPHLQSVEPDPLWRLLSVSWYVRPDSKVGPTYDGFTKLGEVLRDYHVFIDPEAFPRAQVVPQAQVGTDRQVMELLSQQMRRLREVVVLERPLDHDDSGPGGSVSGLQILPNEIKVRCSGPGYLVLSDLYLPGWTAEVDGVRAPVLRANAGLCRAVGLAPGEHLVRLAYRPASLDVGVRLSLFTLLACLGLFLLGRSAQAPGKPKSDRQIEPQLPQKRQRKA